MIHKPTSRQDFESSSKQTNQSRNLKSTLGNSMFQRRNYYFRKYFVCQHNLLKYHVIAFSAFNFIFKDVKVNNSISHSNLPIKLHYLFLTFFRTVFINCYKKTLLSYCSFCIISFIIALLSLTCKISQRLTGFSSESRQVEIFVYFSCFQFFKSKVDFDTPLFAFLSIEANKLRIIFSFTIKRRFSPINACNRGKNCNMHQACNSAEKFAI